MTDEELQDLKRRLRTLVVFTDDDNDEFGQLFRLARRGLRAERETCGTCGACLPEDTGEQWCDEHYAHVRPEDGCSRWRAKEGG